MKANNKIIAEFMGDKPKELLYTTLYIDYSSSWDLLMPVVDKCYQEHMSSHLAYEVMTCDIARVYKAVINLIKEYNDGKE